MASIKSTILTSLAVLTGTASAHGFLTGIRVDGKYYDGWNPAYQYNPSQAPTVAGWSTTVKDTGFVAPSDYSSPDFICHRGAAPGKTSIPVNPGSMVELLWNSWPESHHGPVLNYLAPCNGPCETLPDKSALQFTKIQAEGLISGSKTGYWADDKLINNNFTSSFVMPSNVAPGPYVLRHEIIALHSANEDNGAQHYPQCINLALSGNGADTLSNGVSANSFYTPTDPGIKFNIYTTFSSYPIPGPPQYSVASGTAPSKKAPTCACNMH